jgi:hypothetical protein
MEEKLQGPYFTESGLLIVMILSAMFPVGMNLLAAQVLLLDHHWIGLAGIVLSMLCVLIADAGLFHLWRSRLTEADRRRIGIRTPLIIIFGVAFIPVFTAVQGSPAILTLHQLLH